MPDTNKTESGKFPDAFLRDLGDRFGFDAFRPDLRQELDYIARRYKRDVRLFDSAEDQKAERLRYGVLREQIEALQQMLASPEYADFGSEIFLTLRTAMPDTQVSGLSQLPAANGAAGEHILQLLERLLQLSAATAANVEQRNAPGMGRRPDYALECLVRNIAYLWKDVLQRPFRLDYHKGSVLTQAAEFVIAVAGLVAPDVPQTRLITAMRTIIREQNFVPPVK
ncbi:hypothetical protein [Hyphomonas sp.]|uniref:hypothetical protein n=1 Tax=Hyphomonas sp. TaxID=87 RepID=UPI00391B422B